ncbi:hypothetical protein BJV74DRAFT_797380 [Russula compacta]|nr:hypothetical protein BJV74DRAFT_797380 [Russula compacta]
MVAAGIKLKPQDLRTSTLAQGNTHRSTDAYHMFLARSCKLESFSYRRTTTSAYTLTPGRAASIIQYTSTPPSRLKLDSQIKKPHHSLPVGPGHPHPQQDFQTAAWLAWSLPAQKHNTLQPGGKYSGPRRPARVPRWLMPIERRPSISLHTYVLFGYLGVYSVLAIGTQGSLAARRNYLLQGRQAHPDNLPPASQQFNLNPTSR